MIKQRHTNPTPPKTTREGQEAFRGSLLLSDINLGLPGDRRFVLALRDFDHIDEWENHGLCEDDGTYHDDGRYLIELTEKGQQAAGWMKS